MNTHSELAPVVSPELQKAENIRHAFFTRQGGVSTGIHSGLNAGLGSADDLSSVSENRSRMAAWLGVYDANLVTPYQIHSSDVVIANSPWQGERPKADGLVSNAKNLAIGIVTADCGPVLFADEKNQVIGACHAGWKGALSGVLEQTIARMVELGATPETITAVLGPTIGPDNYEVGSEFPAPFIALDAENEKYFSASKNSGHHMFDLTTYIVDRLAATGVHSYSVNRCTYEDETAFYSYRRTTHRNEPDYGRQLSAIVLID